MKFEETLVKNKLDLMAEEYANGPWDANYTRDEKILIAHDFKAGVKAIVRDVEHEIAILKRQIAVHFYREPESIVNLIQKLESLNDKAE